MTMTCLSVPGTVCLFLEFLIKSTVVLSCAFLLVVLLRKRSASLRHFVLTFFLAGLLFLPALWSLHWGWETGLLPAPATGTGRDWDSGADEGDIRNGPSILGRRAGIGPVLPSTSPSPVLNEAADNEKTSFSSLMRSVGKAARIAFPLVWTAGLAFFLLRLAMGLQGAYRLTREGEFVHDPAWKVLFDRLLVMFRLRRTVHLKSHEDVVVPLTWGLVRPVILIPARYEGWTDDQRASVLLHELSHIKRGDFLVMMFVRLSLSVFWFNPLAWIAYRMMRKEQEKACDELVLRTGVKPSTYAANLLLFKRTSGLCGDSSLALLGMFGKSSLNERLAAILKQKLTLKEVAMKTKIMLGMVAIVTMLVIGIARPEATPSATVSASSVTGSLALDPAEGLTVAEKSSPRASQPAPESVRAEAGQRKAVGQEENAADQTQTQEKDKQVKEKEKEKARTIVITTKDGKQIPVEITVIAEDGSKTLKFGDSVVLKRGDKGELILLGPDGKELEVLKGDPIRLQIKEGVVKVLEGDKALRIVEDGSVWLVNEEGKSRTLSIVKEGEAGKAVTYRIIPRGTEKLAELTITKHATAVHEGADKVHITIKPVKEGKKVIAVGKAQTKPQIAWTVKEDHQELRKKLEELRAKLEKVKAKELDISELERALANMEAELKKREETLKAVNVHLDVKPNVYTVIREKDSAKSHVGVLIGEGSKPHLVTIQTGEKGKFSLAFTSGTDKISRETYERIVDKVKKELPEGCELESDFDEKSGAITLNISGPQDQKGVSLDLVKKLAGIIKEEIKKDEADKNSMSARSV